jgi:phage regulator Rha-like protein
MSSREIADLTGKSHSNVMRDIRDMIEQLEQDSELNSVYISSTYISESSGQAYPCYELDRDTTECLLTGYSAILRMKVIKRWKELESKQATTIPQTYAAALLEAGRLALEVEQQARQLEVKTKKVEQLESLFHSGGTIAQFAKQMNGLNSQQINGWLYANTNWLYDENKGKVHLSGRKQGQPKPSSWRCAAYARDKYLTETTYNIERQGMESIVKYEVQLLAGGKKWLFDKYIAGKLPMKSDWNGEFTHKKDLN